MQAAVHGLPPVLRPREVGVPPAPGPAAQPVDQVHVARRPVPARQGGHGRRPWVTRSEGCDWRTGDVARLPVPADVVGTLTILAVTNCVRCRYDLDAAVVTFLCSRHDLCVISAN